jgi:hypothetical protein
LGAVHKGRLSREGVTKFEVCMGEEKTNEDKRCKMYRGSGLSVQMLQDVISQQLLCKKKTSKFIFTPQHLLQRFSLLVFLRHSQ